MSTINRIPEGEGLEVGVIGSFNPAIFHPEWFLRQKLIGEEDAKEARVNVVGSEVTSDAGLGWIAVVNGFEKQEAKHQGVKIAHHGSPRRTSKTFGITCS